MRDWRSLRAVRQTWRQITWQSGVAVLSGFLRRVWASWVFATVFSAAAFCVQEGLIDFGGDGAQVVPPKRRFRPSRPRRNAVFHTAQTRRTTWSGPLPGCVRGVPGPCRSWRRSAGRAPPRAGAGILFLAPHGVVHDLQVRAADAQPIPNPAARKDHRWHAQRRVRRFDAVHQPRPQHVAAVGQRGRQHGYLQRGDPTPPGRCRCWRCRRKPVR